jgi:hypothetical protein
MRALRDFNLPKIVSDDNPGTHKIFKFSMGIYNVFEHANIAVFIFN